MVGGSFIQCLSSALSLTTILYFALYWRELNLADTHVTIKISQLCLFLENDTSKQSAGILLGLMLMKQGVWLNHPDMSAGCARHCMHVPTRLCHPVLL